METFDARQIPEELLRARFASAGTNSTLFLMSLSRFWLDASLKRATPEKKLRVGYKGTNGSGKSPSAQESASSMPSTVGCEKLLNGWSNIYTTDHGQTLLHFDIEALNSSGIATADDITMKARREWEAHKTHYATSVGHMVEWPEKDKQMPNFSALWEFSVTGSEDEALEAPRELSLYLVDEITEMPETQEFLDATEHAGLLLNRE